MKPDGSVEKAKKIVKLHLSHFCQRLQSQGF